MGFRFSIEHANWLAHILQPTGATPQLVNKSDQRETLKKFLDTFTENFYSSKGTRFKLEKLLRTKRFGFGIRPYVEPITGLYALRDNFRNIPWVALLLPSGNHPESDKLLTDSRYLSELVRIRPEDPGLILQLDQVPKEEISLDRVFPAFKVALSEITRWPGVLMWTPAGDAAFFELSKSREKIRERLRWLFSHLATHYGVPDIQLLKEQFSREVIPVADYSQVKLIHISDLHLGSKLAKRRIARVQSLVASIVRELGEGAPIIPVITGDLMDTPSDDNLGDVRTFMGFLNSLGIEKPILVLGNHDVREDGWLSPQLEQAVNISRSPVVWMDNYCVGFACFNSVNSGRLARGYIGEQELTYVGNAIDEEPDKASSFTMIAALHHHPIPVDRPSWYRRSWYESFLSGAFEKTVALEDAELFLGWLSARSITAVLHGHKHIPRFDKEGNIAVIGCGSTVGKVETSIKGQTYMSLNVVTIDRSRSLLGCRLRAERIPGAGLESVESHELVIKSIL